LEDTRAGTYTYAPYSPAVGLVQMNFSSPAKHAGDVWYGMLAFSSPGAGSSYGYTYNAQGEGPVVYTGTFTLK
jgi:hypothetical protein